jgi:RimJ/RimL family protein N-acetyltransferase
LKPAEWGKGFATEITRSLITHGFEELKLAKVVATIDDENLDSIKVVEKAGMGSSHYEYDEDGRFSVYEIKK